VATCAQPTENTYYVSATLGSDTEGTGSKDCPFATIQKSLDVIATAAISSGEIRIAAGTYETTEPIQILAGISIKGGYSATDWADRAYLTSAERATAKYKTLVKYTGTYDGAYSPPDTMDPVYTMGAKDANTTASTIIEGLTINAKETGVFVAALVSLEGAAPTIQYNTINGAIVGADASVALGAQNGDIKNNTINGGTSTGMSMGIMALGADISVSDNEIDAGISDSSTYGMMIYSATNALILSNNVNGGTANDHTAALVVTASSSVTLNGNQINPGTCASGGATGVNLTQGTSGTVSDNTFSGGRGKTTSSVMLSNSATAEISGNTIEAATADDDGHGIDLYNAGDAKIFNNTIIGAITTNQSSMVINVSGPTSPLIANNTLIGGNSAFFSVIIYLYQGGGGWIENNIIFSEYMGTSGINAADVDSGATAVKNNAFSGTTVYFNGAAMYDYATVGEFETAGVVPEASGNTQDFVIGGATAQAKDAFQDYDAKNFRLSANASTTVIEGGLDLSSDGFTVDKDGVTRNAPWSIGAYESNILSRSR
ncbi:MAG: right-handed parallel beta-helix repeat-containing protein, partial [bacterium]